MTEQTDSATGRFGDLAPGPNAPTDPIAIAGGSDVAGSVRKGSQVAITNTVLAELEAACSSIVVSADEVGNASRDWWPLGMVWATFGKIANRAAALAQPESTEEVAAILRICNKYKIPVTTIGGRSNVTGATVPVFGGLLLDTHKLTGIRSVDDESLTVVVGAGTFGDLFEATLAADYGLTCGHWPQSMTLSTVGGWVACRGAGQLSTRYGKIEDMVTGLEVVLSDGTIIETGGLPRAAAGPDLTQLFVGSEGTLGVITAVQMRVHPSPQHEVRAAYAAPSFDAGLALCRRILRRGATPALLRLYDAIESDRSYQTGDDVALIMVGDEGDEHIIAATMSVVAEEAAALGIVEADVALVEKWRKKRNDVAALEELISIGYVVDTMEVTASWTDAPTVYNAVIEALMGVEGTIAASAHCSHSYLDGGCLYFTFAGKPETSDDTPDTERFDILTSYYEDLWNAGTRAAIENGASLSHHHGVGLNRSRFMKESLGTSFGVLESVKAALDPNGILNPAKLGLSNPFGPVSLP